MSKIFVMVDIEADGPVPGTDLFSMVSLGAVVVEEGLGRTFYGELKPISKNWDAQALAVCNFTREQTLGFEIPREVMKSFCEWVKSLKADESDKLIFISDTAGFDWMFVCWYLWMFAGENPFGFSNISLTCLYKGIQRDMYASFKKLRKRVHSHNALDDAIGNAEVMLEVGKDIKGLL